jgi:FkbM family methyltransferase
MGRRTGVTSEPRRSAADESGGGADRAENGRSPLRSAFVAAFERVLPRVAARLRAMHHLRVGEPELRLVPTLSMPDRISVDVGANRGVYAIAMARHARGVLAVEPNPELARFLRRALPRRCTVLCCALSDESGVAALRIPLIAGQEETYLASLHHEGEGPARVVEVPLKRLDDCVDGPVGLIKIDVEGHELAVLRGADRVLREYGPNLLIEAEERHRPGAVASITSFLADYGYRGLFRDGSRLWQVEAFDPAVHQDVKCLLSEGLHRDRYINNFIFTKDCQLYSRLLGEDILNRKY